MTTKKYDNRRDRGAGTGVIRAGAVPIKRGIWDMYETTNPLIGMFERSYWIESNEKYQHLTAKWNEAALKELATFFEENIKDNIIFLNFSHLRIMGGVSTNAGTSYLRDINRKKRNAERGVVDKFPDVPVTAGYELRLSDRDAVTFLTLWKGYEIVDEN